MSPKSKIIRLQAENVKRLKAVEITPDGAVVVVSGKNGQGKSSVLDAIWMALGGKKAFPRKPVRDGAEEACIRLELEGLIVERKIKPDGRTTLAVSSPDGAKYSSPQAMLDRLVGALSFDPLAFARMEPKNQRELLRELVGLDTSAVDRERAEVYTQRTDVNRQAKRAKGLLDSLPVHEDAPAEPVSVAALTDELRAANEAARKADEAELEHSEMLDVLEHSERRAEQLRQDVRGLEEQLAAARGALKEHEATVMPARRARVEGTKTRAEELRALVPDRSAIEERLAQADSVNAKVRDNARHAEAKAELDELAAEAKALTEKLAELDLAKRHALEAAAFPLDGLGIDDEGVLLDELPFEQASSAQQLRASVAIGLALNPELRVLLVRDGSLLDDESMKLLADLAAEADAQVWLERVGASDLGVVIEDGEVAR